MLEKVPAERRDSVESNAEIDCGSKFFLRKKTWKIEPTL